jgi:hypothetical protein
MVIEDKNFIGRIVYKNELKDYPQSHQWLSSAISNCG